MEVRNLTYLPFMNLNLLALIKVMVLMLRSPNHVILSTHLPPINLNPLPLIKVMPLMLRSHNHVIVSTHLYFINLNPLPLIKVMAVMLRNHNHVILSSMSKVLLNTILMEWKLFPMSNHQNVLWMLT